MTYLSVGCTQRLVHEGSVPYTLVSFTGNTFCAMEEARLIIAGNPHNAKRPPKKVMHIDIKASIRNASAPAKYSIATPKNAVKQP